MNSKTTTIMTVTVLVSILLIFLLKMISTLLPSSPHPRAYVVPEEVRGMSLYYHNLPYTLNFEQQNKFIQLFNRCVPVGIQELDTQTSIAPEKLVIYFFNKEEATLIFKGIEGRNILFNAASWGDQGFRDVSGGAMLELLNSSYDP